MYRYPTLPQVWVVHTPLSSGSSCLIQVSACGAFNRLSAAGAGDSISMLGDYRFILHAIWRLTGVSQLSSVQPRQGCVGHKRAWTRQPGPFTWFVSCHCCSPTPPFQCCFLCRNKCLASLLRLAGSYTPSNTRLEQHLLCEALPAPPLGVPALS